MTTDVDLTCGVTEILHGTSVSDPYRWLENRDLPKTKQWIANQHVHLNNYFHQLGSLTELREHVLQYLDIETVDAIGEVEGRYFYKKRRVGEQQASIFVMDPVTHKEHILVDPSAQGPYLSVNIHSISTDGKLLAYELKQGGEHTKAIHIIDVDSGKLFSDYLERGLARGFAFSAKNDGFYYCHEIVAKSDDSKQYHVVRSHKFGDVACDDPTLLALPRSRSSKLVFSLNGETLSAAFCRQDGEGATVDLYTAQRLHEETWQCIFGGVRMPFVPFFYRDRLFAYCFQERPNGEIVELDSVCGSSIGVVVPEWEAPISHCVAVRDRFYVAYLVGTKTVVRIWSLHGEYLGTIPLEDGCTWRLLPTYTDRASELFLQCESFSTPPLLFRYEPEFNRVVPWHRHASDGSTHASTQQRVAYLSKDRTEIMMSLVVSRDPHELRDRPLIMTAYGGFGLTLTPQYSVLVSVLLDLGFVLALPEIRGGGERGKPWHDAARGRHRQIAFDDFTEAAQWLCDKGFTTPNKLAIFGGSNSGLLVGAAITQRPDLFRAALCIAPLLDMIRYHLFDLANGWAGEYGTADNIDDFHALLSYSPYHHVSEHINYPAVLFVTGDCDTRCNPAHARKMAARLAERPAQRHAILVDHSVERGHSPTMPLSIRSQALIQRIVFLCRELGVSLPKDIHHDMVSC